MIGSLPEAGGKNSRVAVRRDQRRRGRGAREADGEKKYMVVMKLPSRGEIGRGGVREQLIVLV